MSAILAPSDDPLAALDSRLAQVEAFGAQVSQAIESLVSSIVEKNHELTALQGRTRELE